MLAVKDARYIGEYKILIKFSNGREGIADLAELINQDHRTIIAELKDQNTFSNFKTDHDTVVWPNELDLAPEYLFFLSFKHDHELQNQFKSWGYI